MKKIIITLTVALVASVAFLFLGTKQNEKKTLSQNQTRVEKKPEMKNELEQKIDKANAIISKLSARAQNEIVISDYEKFFNDLNGVLDFGKQSESALDISLLTLVDKKHFLQSTYAPHDLVPLEQNNFFSINRNDLSVRREAFDALVALAKAARSDGIELLVSSSYRSFSYQEKVFAKWVAIDGEKEAERESARAGTSQHQLGTAIDFGSIDDSFAKTKMCAWLNENASNFGWSLSFPKSYENETGYRWESWHFRYIGNLACEFQKNYFNDVQQFMLEFINAWLS